MMLQPPEGLMVLYDAYDEAIAEGNTEEAKRIDSIIDKWAVILAPKDGQATIFPQNAGTTAIDLTEFYEGRIVKKES